MDNEIKINNIVKAFYGLGPKRSKDVTIILKNYFKSNDVLDINHNIYDLFGGDPYVNQNKKLFIRQIKDKPFIVIEEHGGFIKKKILMVNKIIVDVRIDDAQSRLTKTNHFHKYDLYVINLERRSDRKLKISEMMANQKLFNISWFKACEHQKGSFGCGLSHLNLISYAKKMRLPYILVMEDDNMFIRDMNQIEAILDWLIANHDSWEIFNGNPTFWSLVNGDTFYKSKYDIHYLKKYTCANNNLCYLNWGQMTNFIIYNNSVYDKMLLYMYEINNMHIDQYISIHFQQICPRNYITSQYQSTSDVSNYQHNIFNQSQTICNKQIDLSHHLSIKKCNSFDVFDTILARLRIHPYTIFDQIEKEYPFNDFRRLRSIAEQKSNGSYDSIYNEFKNITGMSVQEINKLKEYEINVERNNMFLIKENYNKICNNDILVSDMYLSKDSIYGLLQANGFNKNVELFVSYNGKSNGYIWDEIRKKYSIIKHYGDNEHSDVKQAITKGINAELYVESNLTEHEKYFFNKGYHELCYYMRYVRLSNPYLREVFPHEYELWKEQSQLNLPFLIFCCTYINHFMKNNNKKKVLFATRDGCHMIKLFNILYPQYEACEYHCSRRMYNIPSKDYIEYVDKIVDDTSVIFDLHGGGYSSGNFFNVHLKEKKYCILYAVLQSLSPYINSDHVKGIAVLDSESVEKLNYDLRGSLYDFINGFDVRGDIEYDTKYIQICHDAINFAVKNIELFRVGETGFTLDDYNYLLKYINEHIYIAKMIKHKTSHDHDVDKTRLNEIMIKHKCNSELSKYYTTILQPFLLLNKKINIYDVRASYSTIWNEYFDNPCIINSDYKNISNLFFDVIIDKSYCSHQLFKKLKFGGIYIIEDVDFTLFDNECICSGIKKTIIIEKDKMIILYKI